MSNPINNQEQDIPVEPQETDSGKKILDDINNYFSKHPIKDEDERKEDYPQEAHINDMSIDGLVDLVYMDGQYFTNDNGDPCVLSSYGRLVKLLILRDELMRDGKKCSIFNTDWIPNYGLD